MAKKILAVKRTSKLARLRWFFVVSVLVLVAGAVLFLHHANRRPGVPIVINGYIAKIKTWVATRKSRINHGINKVKQLAANKNEAEPEVHFEFYNTLPNMQVTVSTAKPVELPSKSQLSSASATEKPNKKNSPQVALLKKTFDADVLEREFSKHLESKNKPISK